jgi:NAD+ diphosphatase
VTLEMPFAAPADYAGAIVGPDPAPERALWYVFRESRLLVTDGDAALPAAISALPFEPLRTQYLGLLADRHVFAAEVGPDIEPPAGYRWSDLRSLFPRLHPDEYALAGRALQLVDWDRTHQFCGRCGTPTLLRTDERSRQCPACGLVSYPRLAPAVMALVRRAPDELLLARSPRFPPGMYSALAGFVEPGETLEQCLHREVLEEVGVRVRGLVYFASQPWPFPHSLMIAFMCEWASGDIRADALEIEDARWFNIADLPQLPQPISIARRLIDAALNEMTGGGAA